MQIFLTTCHVILIFLLARHFWKKETDLKIFFWPSLVFKLLAGVTLGLLYLLYYSTADTFAYFQDGSKLADVARENFSAWLRILFSNTAADDLQLSFDEPRALFLTKITSVFNIVTNDNYWITGAYYSAICFSGSWALCKAISRNIPSATLPAVAAFLFLPSVVFWTSGVLKESLAVAALYYLSAFFLTIWFEQKIRVLETLATVVSLWILWNLKYYYAAVFIPVVCASLLYKFALAKRLAFSASVEFVVWLGLLMVPVIVITFLHPNFYPDRLFQVILINNAVYNELSHPDGVVHFHDLRATAMSLVENTPWALFSGLFRPLAWETSGPVPFLAGVENIIVLCLFVVAGFHFKRYFSSPYRLLILAAAAYVVALCVLLTFSAPNFGTLSRYRAGYYSFFVFLILCANPILQNPQRTLHKLVSH